MRDCWAVLARSMEAIFLQIINKRKRKAQIVFVYSLLTTAYIGCRAFFKDSSPGLYLDI